MSSFHCGALLNVYLYYQGPNLPQFIIVAVEIQCLTGLALDEISHCSTCTNVHPCALEWPISTPLGPTCTNSADGCKPLLNAVSL